MQRLTVFNHVSADGFFGDSRGDMRWAHKTRDDREWNEFVASNASGDGTLLFGRKTYDMMASYWPTPMAKQIDPAIADRMNSGKKAVASKSLKEATWNNTQLLQGDLSESVNNLKQQPGSGIVILGSGSIVSQLTAAGLVDEIQLIVNPIVLGNGRTLFGGIAKPVDLKLIRSRSFANGNTLLCFEPAKK